MATPGNIMAKKNKAKVLKKASHKGKPKQLPIPSITPARKAGAAAGQMTMKVTLFVNSENAYQYLLHTDLQ